MTDIKREISKVRSALILDHPFFGALTLHGELTPDDGVKDVPHIDGETLRLNPERFTGMRHAERKAEVAAAFLACGLGHPFRKGERDTKAWSKASCILTGKMIKDSGMHLPEDWPTIPLGIHVDENTTIENLYATLKQVERPGGDKPGKGGGKGGDGSGDGDGEGEGKGKGKGKGNGKGDGDGGGQGGYQLDDPTTDEGKGMTEAEKAEAEAEWEISTIQAARAAKAMGNAPGFIEAMLAQIMEPKIPWQSVLREFVEIACKNDYSFKRPNHRYSTGDIIMPGLDGMTMGRIGIFHDTSGSVSSPELEMGYGEMNSILQEFPGIDVLFIQADTRVADVQELSSEDLPLVPTIKGRGGTSFKPPFQYVDDENEELTCAIYFTDGECNDFPPEPDYPVLWVYTQDPNGRSGSWCQEPPWGRLIVVDIH